ncbi:hypothetical protein; putative signal peptide [Bradyrhizobium sp. ORS 278]|uniref:hypothetical protein n=1 Tax=Bradyrhizobium sp. (strain ORS 278) TaxID=114615 RepID=UPI0001507A19|nr:hypothetical protein [Bradyrhizobium sp. ORS 278]CAL74768.1 hypothetical protein; putative signal peptide [Bradyrhizobium sp. ORS 278]
MIGHFQATSQFSSMTKLGAAALLSTVILALPGAARAGQANTDMVNGQYCNAMCKAYMAWSNRMLAITQPNYARPQIRVAVPETAPPQKADRAERTEPRMTQHPPKPHRPANLNSFAQLPGGSRAAQPAMDAPQPDDGSAAYAGAQMGRMLSTDPQPAVAGLRGSTTEGADMRLVSISDTGMPQDPRTVGDASSSARSKMPSIWMILAAAALVAFFGHGWLKRRSGPSEEAL